jgi:mono/diheme cytochrome c family protein
LSGGNNLSADSGLPLGDIYPPNITPAGKIQGLSDGDIMRILRTGIEPGGRLTFMNFVNTRHLSDADAQAIIAYLRQAPSVSEQRPPVQFSFLTMLFVGAGLISPDVPSSIQPVTAPPKAPSQAYGEYVVNFMDCRSCHGPTLSGDAPPPAPKAPNLTLFMPNWTKDDFFQAMRTGVDKTGHQIQPPMPWKTIGLLDDVELQAVYEYLHNLPPIQVSK